MRFIKQYQSVKKLKQAGFSLVELMVGLVIGLLATLAIMQVFSAFEGQKRTTSGTADAQTSGSIALYTLQRDLQLAGFGLPLYDEANMPLKCNTPAYPVVDHDNNAVTPNINMSAVDIIDGTNATDSDTVIVRYSASASGGVPVPVVGIPNIALKRVAVNNNMACFNADVVYAVTGNTCDATRVNDNTIDPVATPVRTNYTTITLSSLPASIVDKTSLSCLTRWNEIRYLVDTSIANNPQLARLDTFGNTAVAPVVSGIVNMQAQYGISANPTSNQITQWVNATGAWETKIDPVTGIYTKTPGNTSNVCNALNANRNCIKAVRVAIVARNGLLEKLPAVSNACSSTTVANPTGVCAWDATSANPIVASPAPVIDLSNTASWNQYRYKVYETIIPMRNVVWTRERLS